MSNDEQKLLDVFACNAMNAYINESNNYELIASKCYALALKMVEARKIILSNEVKQVSKLPVKNEIPDYMEFEAYAISKNKNISIEALRLKYDAWVENNWKDGKNKKITNWKSKLLQTIPYLQQNQGLKLKSIREQKEITEFENEHRLQSNLARVLEPINPKREGGVSK